MISKLANAIEKLFKIISATILLLLFIVIFMQVVLRYCFNTGFKWIDGVSVMGFVWMGMLGSAIGLHTDALPKVTLVADKFKKNEALIFWMQKISCLAFMIVLSYASILFVKQSGGAIYQLLKIPYSVQYIAVCVFAISSIIFLADDIAKRVKARKEG